MKLFLQVGLSNWQQGGFGNLFVHFASSLSGDLMGTDLDSQSEPLIADLVERLVDQSQDIFLFVLANDPNLPLGSAHKVFTNLQKAGKKVSQVVLCGDHRSAESFLINLSPRFTKETDPAKIKELIRQFSKAN